MSVDLDLSNTASRINAIGITFCIGISVVIYSYLVRAKPFYTTSRYSILDLISFKVVMYSPQVCFNAVVQRLFQNLRSFTRFGMFLVIIGNA